MMEERSDDLDEDNLMYPESDEFEYEDNEKVLGECRALLASKDFIMEPMVGGVVKRFLGAGGPAEEFATLLSGSYDGIAQAANLLADWLIVAGASVQEVQELVEEHLKNLIMKNFDPKKADSIFSGYGQPPAWIEEMILHLPWRVMFYELSEKYPDCLMLNFTIKLIADAGFQAEIGTISSACNQIEVYSKVLKTSVIRYLNSSHEDRSFVVEDMAKAACHGKLAYLYSQCMLVHAKEMLGGDKASAGILRLSQELAQSAQRSGHRIWYLRLLCCGCGAYPRLFSPLLSVLEKNALNPGDVTALYKVYSGSDPPPVDLLRIPELLELFIEQLFKPGSSVPSDHRSKYTYLLAYAASVYEELDGTDVVACKDELNSTIQAIERVHSVCAKDIGAGSLQFAAEAGLLYQCIRYPVVALGIMVWVRECLSEENYLAVINESTPLQLVILDEVSSSHPLQHELVLNLLTSLFARNFSELDTLVELELKRTILDRMTHLLSRGYVLPVVAFVKSCMESQLTDVSLLRHFVVEVLEMIAPPYSPSFVELFLPIVSNSEVTATLQSADKEDDVSQFLAQCENG